MQPQLINTSQFRNQALKLVRQAEGGQDFIIVNRSKPAAVLIAYEFYEKIRRRLETEEILLDKNLMRQIKEGLEYFKKGGKGYTLEETFGEVSRKKRPSKKE